MQQQNITVCPPLALPQAVSRMERRMRGVRKIGKF